MRVFEGNSVPFITTAQMVKVDRLMMEEYRILLPQMMENAGRALARLARERFLDGDPRSKRVVVLAGGVGRWRRQRWWRAGLCAAAPHVGRCCGSVADHS